MGFGQMGIGGLLLIAVVVLVLFGRGKVANLMGEVGKGITAFRRGMNDASNEVEDQSTATAETARDVTPETERDNA